MATMWIAPLLLLVFSGVVSARPLEVADLAQLKLLPPTGKIMSMSGDGRWLAYSVNAIPMDADRGGGGQYSNTGAPANGYSASDIYVIDMQTGATVCVTGHRGRNVQPAWSPDGGRLAFYSDRDELMRLWVWERKTGTLRRVSPAVVRSSPFSGARLQWMPDGRTLIALVLPEGMTVAQANDRGRTKHRANAGAVAGATVAIWRAPLARHDINPITNWAVMEADWALVDADSGELRRLGSSKATFWYAPSPDGQWIAFSHQTGVGMGKDEAYYDLEIARADRGTARKLLQSTLADYGEFRWSPDSQALSYIAADQQREGNVHLVNRDSGDDRIVTRQPHEPLGTSTRGANAALWAADGRDLLFVANRGLWRVALADGTAKAVTASDWDREVLAILPDAAGFAAKSGTNGKVVVQTRLRTEKSGGIFSIALATGKASQVVEEPKHYGDALLAGGTHTVIWVAEDAQHPPDLWALTKDTREPRRLTRINAALADVEFGAARVIDYSNRLEGATQAALLLPSDYTAGRRVPLIVWPYPGDSDPTFGIHVFGFDFATGTHNLQMLATRSYAVLRPRVPQRAGTPLADLVDGVNAAVDRVVEMGVADADRLGIGGASYGGYSTLAMVTHTSRFKGAMAACAPSDLVSMYGNFRETGLDDSFRIEHGQFLMEGTPWQHLQRYIDNSPIFFLDRVTTPVLLIHGAADDNVPVQQSDEFFVGLRRLSKVVEYRRYLGEDHSLTGLQNIADYWNSVIQWYDRYVKRAAVP